MGRANSSDFLGTEPIFRVLLRMAVPSAAAMIVNALYNVVDSIFVGQTVGSLAIAALSIVFPLQMLVSALAQALSVGAASIASRRLGARDERAAARAVGTAYAAIGIVTALVVTALFIWMKPILTLFGATETILPYTVEYITIVAPGFFFFAVSMAASTLVRAEGKARTSMTGMIIGAVSNIILDALFIVGFRMGIGGAALATVIGQFLAAAFLLSTYLRGRSSIPFKRSDLRVRFRILPEMVLLGVPMFVQSAGMSVLQLVTNNSLGYYGGDRAIAAYGMTFRLIMMVIFPIIGIAQGMQPVVGYNYGAEAYDRVRAGIRNAILLAFAVSSLAFAAMMGFPRACVSMFIDNPEMIAYTARVVRIMTLFIPLAAIQIVSSAYFQAVGKPNESLILGLSRQFLILIPLILVLPRILGITGIWYAFPASDFLATCITVVLLVRELRHLGAAT